VNANAKGSNYFDLLDAYAEYAFSDKIAFGAGRSTEDFQDSPQAL
jgi:hypothetical protein